MFLWFNILGWIFIAAALAGNAFVVYLIATRKRLHTVANCFLTSLAVADFFTGGWSIWSCTDCKMQCSCFDKTAVFLISMFFFVSSITSLCVMTVERWVAIVWPLKYINLMTKKRVTLFISLAWIFPFLLFLPPFIFSLSDDNGEIPLPGLLWKGFFLLVFVALDLVPCLVLLVTTSHILYIARKHSRQTAVLVAQVSFNYPLDVSVRLNQLNRQTREFSAGAICVFVAVFVASHLAHVYVLFCLFFKVRSLSEPKYYCITKLFSIINSALNPVAYSFLKRDIKAEVKRLFRFNAVANRTLEPRE